ncbi:CGP-CTERM sorting domain-containing protein [Micromonospora sp. 15K316]|nr:CGP-CTERM sorting domain-containing protein [Micromonospora sp. 15K316]
MSDPATYRNDWGGPSLAGVLLVHCGPGVVAAVVITAVLLRRRRAGRARG